VGKIIDAQFSGRNADDRYCASCRERYPRRSALCPRCGGSLTLWATYARVEDRKAKRTRLVGGVAGLFATLFLIILALIWKTRA